MTSLLLVRRERVDKTYAKREKTVSQEGYSFTSKYTRRNTPKSS